MVRFIYFYPTCEESLHYVCKHGVLLGQSGVGWVTGRECKSHSQGTATETDNKTPPTPKCFLSEDSAQRLPFACEEGEAERWKKSVAGPSPTADLAVNLWPPDPPVREPCHP